MPKLQAQADQFPLWILNDFSYYYFNKFDSPIAKNKSKIKRGFYRKVSIIKEKQAAKIWLREGIKKCEKAIDNMTKWKGKGGLFNWQKLNLMIFF